MCPHSYLLANEYMELGYPIAIIAINISPLQIEPPIWGLTGYSETQYFSICPALFFIVFTHLFNAMNEIHRFHIKS